jgi:hypothetical protein
MRDISQIAILANSNLFLFLARKESALYSSQSLAHSFVGGSFFTMPLSALHSGSSMPDPDITLVSKHVSCFTVYRRTCAHERHRVCVVKRSAFSDTPSLQVYDVAADNHLLGLGFRLRVSTLNSMVNNSGCDSIVQLSNMANSHCLSPSKLTPCSFFVQHGLLPRPRKRDLG